jgi:hypothetical protein
MKNFEGNFSYCTAVSNVKQQFVRSIVIVFFIANWDENKASN